MPVALIGLPGSVQSEVLQAVCDALAYRLADVDSAGQFPGSSVQALSVDEITDPGLRRRLRSGALTIWIDGDDEMLAERAGLSSSELHRLRKQYLGALTTAADVIVGIDTDGSAASIASRVSAAVSRPRTDEHNSPAGHITETVAFDDGRSYPIHIGRGVIELLPGLIPARAKKVAVITQESIGLEVDSGREQRTFMVDDGEKAKRLDVIGQLASSMAQWEMTRADVVVSIGGGVVSDLAGYLAASYHRGIPVIHVSTTLLGQIDAAIGGKCGVNLPEGKNLVGAFWQPTAVLCEIDALSTLPAREFVSGMGELAKYHFLGGGELDRQAITERVAHSARIKADVVSGDEREGGRRAILNYGHTLAHALETIGSYDIRHGEAVAVGLIYAAELAHRMGRIDADRVAEHRRVVARYGLEASFAGEVDHQEIVDLFSRDKKAIDGVTFVLDGPTGVEPVKIDDNDLLLDTISTVAR